MTKPKDILFDDEAREKLGKGIDQLADVVGVTLGPKGRNVGLEATFGSPVITNDGNSIIKDIEVKDAHVNLGISLGKEVASKIKEASGDGTTTGIVLLRAMVKLGIKNIASGANPTAVKRGMDQACKKILEKIDQMAIEVKTDQEIANIATVSASGNAEIGKMIAEGIKKAGKSGVVTIEEGKGTETTLDIVEGMQFDRGYLSPYFCTSQEKMIVEMNRPKILITDKKISSIQELIGLLQPMAGGSQEFLIIAEDLEGDVLSTLVINKLKGILKVCAIKAPSFGDSRKALLEDIAILTGGQFITEEKGLILKEATLELLGSCDKVIITKDETTIITEKTSNQAISDRVKQIEKEISLTTSSYEKEKLEERKAKLAGGVALIKVGAFSEAEMKQKKQAFEDSLNSTKAALESGILPGGGTAFIFAKDILDELRLSEDEMIGVNIVKQACLAPFKQIAKNAEYDPFSLLEEINKKGFPYGFNTKTEKVENLLKSGIIDPVKIVKNCLTYANSSAGIILLSDALICDAEDE